ncbi:MAG: hypothetical protein SX243_10920 [Acidobacteriota bacterium]|nr:hypothetical protein [Acidobacteriota bacterium]
MKSKLESVEQLLRGLEGLGVVLGRLLKEHNKEIFEEEFGKVLKGLRRRSLPEREAIYEILRRVVRAKMVAKGYDRRHCDGVANSFSSRLESILREGCSVRFSELLEGARRAYVANREDLEIHLSGRARPSGLKREIPRLVRFVLSGSFIAADFDSLVTAGEADESLRVSIFVTIFMGVMALLETAKA